MTNNKKPISIRFSEEELNFIKHNASINNQSISDFIRQKVLEENKLILSEKEDKNLKIIKAVSICAGFVETFVKHRFSDDEYKNYQEKVKKILEINLPNLNINP